ncbi:MAG: FHA domain-containing protein [Lachnospiraceae bacterium]|nr:FHA domain-containing protein [Lachnospiraceae bacterium]
MKLTKCPNNHYYNADKLPFCPHCIHVENGISVSDIRGERQADIDTVSVHTITPPADFQKKTIGWLVCVEGNTVGESFTVYDCDNYIGRSSHMNICLSKEPTVSRESHACISYNKETKDISIAPTSDGSPVLLNDALLTETHTLSNRNLIQLGDCVLLFVALCDEDFSW